MKKVLLCSPTLLLVGYILLSAGNLFSWKPLIWIGIPILLIGIVGMAKDIWTGCQQKTLTSWRLGLKICGLVLGILLLIVSVMVAFGVGCIHLSTGH